MYHVLLLLRGLLYHIYIYIYIKKLNDYLNVFKNMIAILTHFIAVMICCVCVPFLKIYEDTLEKMLFSARTKSGQETL